jgi:hypothetical protein
MRSRLQRVGQWRGGGEPEADEEGDGLVADRDVPLEAFGAAGQAIKAAGERGLQALGAVGRQEAVWLTRLRAA